MCRERVHDYNWLHDSLLIGVDGVLPPVRIFGQSLPAFRAIREVLLAGDTNRQGLCFCMLCKAMPKGNRVCFYTFCVVLYFFVTVFYASYTVFPLCVSPNLNNWSIVQRGRGSDLLCFCFPPSAVDVHLRGDTKLIAPATPNRRRMRDHERLYQGRALWF